MMKLGIIGASYLQNPLILKAKSMGIETHVFAWRVDDVGEKSADYFYDISIIEKERILEKCIEIGIDGICSIASDLAMVTVNYVACHMGLVGNSLECTLMSTNKNKMRECFERNNIPSPRSILVNSVDDLVGRQLTYPIIVKPLDRSGSRGITKLSSENGLYDAIENAKKAGFIKQALVEEFVDGQEYSVESISWQGKHTILAITKKYTTGAPNFIETAHLEPAYIEDWLYRKIKKVVLHALDSLEIKNGASHSELKVNDNGDIKIIEIGGRMGGDCIGSSLVHLSTGYDFVQAVIQVALGTKPDDFVCGCRRYAGVRFICSQEDILKFEEVKGLYPDLLVEYDVNNVNGSVTDSSTRFGYFIMSGEDFNLIGSFMPKGK